LIQTPEDAEGIQLIVNDVRLTLGSTAYLQADVGNMMTTYVLEGQATLDLYGLEQIVPAGTKLSVPINDDPQVNEQPWSLEFYEVEPLQTLPISLLERQIEIASPPDASYLSIYLCEVDFGSPVIPGQLVFIGYGVSGYSSVEQAINDNVNSGAVITVDGNSLPIVRSDPINVHPDGSYGKSEFVAWIATPGTHTFTGAFPDLRNTSYAAYLFTCSITVP
jgi:hypothetical protein